MELEEQLIDFAERIQSGCGPYVSYDEVQQWPKGRLEELLGMGVLIKTTPAKEINCTECSGMDCPPIEPSIETFPGASEPEGAYLCKKEGGGGLIRIPLERMKRWEIVVEKLKELGYCKAGYEVPWDIDNVLYIPLQDAANMANDDSLTLRKLSKLLKDIEFPVHHMHKGRRCRVYLPEFKNWLKYTQLGISDAAIDKYLKGAKARQEAILQKKKASR